MSRIAPAPIDSAQLDEDEAFLDDLGGSTLHGSLPDKTVERLFWLARRNLAAVKHAQSGGTAPPPKAKPKWSWRDVHNGVQSITMWLDRHGFTGAKVAATGPSTLLVFLPDWSEDAQPSADGVIWFREVVEFDVTSTSDKFPGDALRAKLDALKADRA